MAMEFPSSRTSGCDDWCAALHLVEKAVTGKRWAKLFDVDDFMIMSRTRGRRPRITLYKHWVTRCYLNVGDDGRTYGYRPRRAERDGGSADYQPIPLHTAIEHLELDRFDWAILADRVHGERVTTARTAGSCSCPLHCPGASTAPTPS